MIPRKPAHQTIQLAWIVFMLSLISPVSAQITSWPALRNTDIGVSLSTGDHPALSQAFVDRVYERTEQIIKMMWGGETTIQRTSYPNLDAWLEVHSLDDLDAQKCSQLGVNQHAKEIIIHLDYNQGKYQITVSQYDQYLQALQNAISETTLQRMMVNDVAARLAVQSWSPIGVVIGQNNNHYQVVFPDVSNMSALQEWGLLRVGSILQLYSETLNQTQLRQSSGSTSQFLIVSEINDSGILAKLALPESANSGWFQHLGHRHARYLTRIVRPLQSPLNVEVSLVETGAPREGCAVYLSTSSPEEDYGELIGLTNTAGRLSKTPKIGSLSYLTVSYEDLKKTRVIVPGVTPSRLDFSFPYRGQQSRQQLVLQGLETQLSNYSLRIQQRVQELEAVTQKSDVDRAEQLAAEIDELLSKVNSLDKRIQVLNRSSEYSQASVSSRLKELSTNLAKAQTDVGKVEDAVTIARMNRLKSQFETHWNAQDWELAREDLQSFLKNSENIDGDYPILEQKFQLLESALKNNDSDLTQARKVVENSIGIEQLDQLQRLWPSLKKSLEILNQKQDYLWLIEIYDEFLVLSELLKAEGQRLTAVKNSQTLELEESEELLEKLIQNRDQSQELTRIVSAATKIIKTVESTWSN